MRFLHTMRFVLVLLFPLLLSACFLVPHKVDVRQGNYVDEEMISKLRLNMTREQVLFAVGTPLVIDPFHPNRWDYVYMVGPAGSVDRVRGLSLEFDENRLVRVHGDVTIVGDSLQLQVQAVDR
ncbi:MAG: outer membrane protein assembly factor BamE [Burkholderiales bacterium]|nr:outer membrane protein assembly factor BamE [Burkholderiales bacterium]